MGQKNPHNNSLYLCEMSCMTQDLQPQDGTYGMVSALGKGWAEVELMHDETS